MSSAWSGAPTWCHGDVAVGNLLTIESRLSAVIDFGCVGDPACDLVMAWTYFTAEERRAFHEAVGLVGRHLEARPRLGAVEGTGAVPLHGELTEAVRHLKSEGEGDVVILGSGDVARQLMAAGLIDELRLFIHPLLLGTGKQLFGEVPTPRALRLTSVSTTSKGTLAVVYTLDDRAEELIDG